MWGPEQDEILKAILPRVEKLARKYVSPQAEFDDLVQEGWIASWHALQQGVHPSDQAIEWRMLNWVRYVRRHDNASYEETVGKYD